ncbi:MAG: TIGR00366 family protein, partial [Calditrichaeota bacterium]|nr:TIGR00366 family protein [Calditrichota bacterium]
PSGSGQAALTIPVMAPLADLIGVSRQTAVLAFQFGDGFSNLIIPTSAVTMGVLALAEIPWEKWARWILPLEILFFVLSLLLLIPPFLINWQ